MKNLKTNWLLKHTFTVFSCVLIVAFGIAFLSHADPVTTTIGENIATNDLSVSGNVTSGTWQGTAVGTQYGGTGQDWSAVAQGNLPYFSAEGALSNLAPGTAGQFLKSQGTGSDPAWANVTRSATFVVAANDSSALSKQQADYVCDGTDDQVEIQAAIDAAVASGNSRHIHFMGEFLISSTVEITASGDYLFTGDGRVSYFNFRSDGGLTDPLFHLHTGSAILTHWKNLSFRKDGGATPAILVDASTDLQIDSCIFWYSGIDISGAGNVWIRNCWIENCYAASGYGIKRTSTGGSGGNTRIDSTYFYACSPALDISLLGNYEGGNRFAIHGCNIHYSKTHGIEINRSFHGILISDNLFTSNGVDATNTYDAIHLKGAQFVSILDNKFGNNRVADVTRYGIYLENGAGGEVCSNILIRDNDFLYGGKGATGYPTPAVPPTGYYDMVSGAVYATAGNEAAILARGNLGYTTENSGTATITAAQTLVDVTHSLATTPTRIQLTPTTDTAGKRYWISAKGATTFTITIDSTHTSDISFDWRAVVGEGN